MKLTATQLRRIIKEEVQRSLNEEKELKPELFDREQGNLRKIQQNAQSVAKELQASGDKELDKELLGKVLESLKDIWFLARAVQVNIDVNRNVLPGLKK